MSTFVEPGCRVLVQVNNLSHFGPFRFILVINVLHKEIKAVLGDANLKNKWINFIQGHYSSSGPGTTESLLWKPGKKGELFWKIRTPGIERKLFFLDEFSPKISYDTNRLRTIDSWNSVCT
jgi:hypothetical protein